MKNQPYIKQYNELGEVLNPITKDQPYLHTFVSKRGQSGKKYVEFYHPITGRYIGRVKAKGNNRANTCKRNKQSRNRLLM